MKTVVACLLYVVFCTTVSVADEILVKRERTDNGKTRYYFSNTNVNTDKYDTEYSFRGMTASEREQADRIDKENQRTRNEEMTARQQRENAEQAKVMAEQRAKEERIKNRPIIIPAPIVNVW
jgi:hypothetical protein